MSCGAAVCAQSSTIDFSLCLGATASEKLAQRTKIKASQGSGMLEKKDEIVANVIWRFLELRGCVPFPCPSLPLPLSSGPAWPSGRATASASSHRHSRTVAQSVPVKCYQLELLTDGAIVVVSDRFLLNTHIHSPLARAMYSALRQARVNDKFQDSLYLFLELVRAGVVHGHLWSGRAFSGGPSFGTGAYSCLLHTYDIIILPSGLGSGGGFPRIVVATIASVV